MFGGKTFENKYFNSKIRIKNPITIPVIVYPAKIDTSHSNAPIVIMIAIATYSFSTPFLSWYASLSVFCRMNISNTASNIGTTETFFTRGVCAKSPNTNISALRARLSIKIIEDIAIRPIFIS